MKYLRWYFLKVVLIPKDRYHSALAHSEVEEPPVAEPIEDVPAVTVPDSGYFTLEQTVNQQSYNDKSVN